MAGIAGFINRARVTHRDLFVKLSDQEVADLLADYEVYKHPRQDVQIPLFMK